MEGLVMRVTTDHSASSYGVPVILADGGEVMDYAPGIKAIREKLSMSTQNLADACGVSCRTVEGWEQGRMPDAAALNVMSALLRRRR
jgi:DNA-binding XRE family transcriptional regulator